MKPHCMNLSAKVAALALALLATLTTQAPAQTRPAPFVIKAAAPSLTIAVQLAMVARGIDKAHGFTTDLQASGTSSAVTINAVLSGQADFGSPGTADALQAIRAGANLKIIGVSPTAPIAERIRALKGLTVATGAVGSTHYQILRAYLKQYGLNPDTDLRLIGLGDTSALITGIELGRYDAIAYASGVVEKAIADKAAMLWISGPGGDIPGSDEIKTCVIVVRAEMVETRKADIDAFRAGLQEALRAVNGDHAATGAMLHDTYFPKLDPAVWELAWNGATRSYPADLAFSRASWDYWIANDPKGAASFKDVDYAAVTYAPAQQP